MPMLIMISGPISAGTKAEEEENVARLNRAAAEVLGRGHVPLVGVNVAAPVVDAGEFEDRYEAIMKTCLALAERCDAVLVIGESGGARREREVFERAGRPVYHALEEIPNESAPPA
jgi:hypothetical protein